MQIYASLNVIAGAAGAIAEAPVPVVIDHFGLALAEAGPGQPGFDALLDLVAGGHVYVKLSAPHRVSPAAPDHADVAPLARALIAAGPQRMIWGSDWPHTVSHSGRPALEVSPFREVDDLRNLGLLEAWAGDAALARAILVDNPARLYGFG